MTSSVGFHRQCIYSHCACAVSRDMTTCGVIDNSQDICHKVMICGMKHTHTLFKGSLTGTTRVDGYQKKCLLTRTHSDRQTFLYELPPATTIHCILFSLHAWQSFFTTPVAASWKTGLIFTSLNWWKLRFCDLQFHLDCYDNINP